MNTSFWGLIVLLALLAAAPFVARRFGRRQAAGGGNAGVELRVLGSVALGTHHRVVAIDAGHGHQRSCLVLGLAQGQVTLLHRFEGEAAAAPAPDAATAAPAETEGWRDIARRAGLPV